MSCKEAVLEAVRQLPEEATFDEILEEIAMPSGAAKPTPKLDDSFLKKKWNEGPVHGQVGNNLHRRGKFPN